MHTVGRTYALDQDASLADLKDYLPRSNDPGVQRRLRARARDRRRAVDRSTSAARGGDRLRRREATRYRRYSCVHGLGHAFMRIHDDRLEPALDLCSGARRAGRARLRTGRLPRLLVRGRWRGRRERCRARPVTDPRELCGRPAGGVRAPVLVSRLRRQQARGHRRRLARAFRRALRRPRRPSARGVRHGRVRDRPGRPGGAARALRAARRVPATQPAVSAATKVQNLLGAPIDAFVRLIGRCETFAGYARAARATAGSARRSPSSPTARSPARAARGSTGRRAGSAPPARGASTTHS